MALDTGQTGILEDAAATINKGEKIDGLTRGHLRAMKEMASASEQRRIDSLLVKSAPEKPRVEPPKINTANFEHGKQRALKEMEEERARLEKARP